MIKLLHQITKYTFFLLFFTLSCYPSYSQVGINNDNPQATLDVSIDPTNNNATDGIIFPRLTGNDLLQRPYGSQQQGCVVYVTAIPSSPTGAGINIDQIGLYYFDGSLWQKVITSVPPSLYTGDDSLTDNRTVTLGSNNIIFSGTGKMGVGQNVGTPTTTLDIDGNVRIRTLTGVSNNTSTSNTYAQNILATDTQGNLVNTNTSSILYSTGLYTKSYQNNSWRGILVGTKEAKLEFFGRHSTGSLAINFSLLYSSMRNLVVIQSPIGSSSGTQLTITNLTQNSFDLVIGSLTLSFAMTVTGGLMDIQVTNAGSSWIQGTWTSLPNLN